MSIYPSGSGNQCFSSGAGFVACCHLSMCHRQKTLVGGVFCFVLLFFYLPQCWLLVLSGTAVAYRLARLGVQMDPTLPSALCFLTWRVCVEACLLPAEPPRAVGIPPTHNTSCWQPQGVTSDAFPRISGQWPHTCLWQTGSAWWDELMGAGG